MEKTSDSVKSLSLLRDRCPDFYARLYGLVKNLIPWLNFPLNSAEIAKKASSLADYETQLQVLGDFMEQFIRPYEVFRSIDLAEFALQSRMGAGDLHGEDV